jgi:hypothetical protein
MRTMLDELIKTETDADGRTRYTVGGILATYNADEANDLTSTGVFRIACPLTRAATVPAAGHEMYAARAVRYTVRDQMGHGSLDKWPWE